MDFGCVGVWVCGWSGINQGEVLAKAKKEFGKQKRVGVRRGVGDTAWRGKYAGG